MQFCSGFCVVAHQEQRVVFNLWGVLAGVVRRELPELYVGDTKSVNWRLTALYRLFRGKVQVAADD